MKDKLILKDKTEIEIESLSSLSDIKVVSKTKYDTVSIWDAMTQENLSEVQIQNADRLTIGRYENLILESETSTLLTDGTILTSFHLREKTEIEKRLDSLEEGQEVQDGAITDLGEAVSGLAEEGGLT